MSDFLDKLSNLGAQFGCELYLFPAAFGGISDFTGNAGDTYQLEEIKVIAQLEPCPGGPPRGALDFYDLLGCNQVYSEQVFQQKVLYPMTSIASLMKDPALLHRLIMFFQAHLTTEKPELPGAGLRIMNLKTANPKSPKEV